jgi:hypothetical protein
VCPLGQNVSKNLILKASIRAKLPPTVTHDDFTGREIGSRQHGGPLGE